MYTSHGLYFFSGESFEVIDGAGILHKYLITLDENKAPCFYETAKMFGMDVSRNIECKEKNEDENSNREYVDKIIEQHKEYIEGWLEGLRDRIDRIDTLLVSQEKELEKIKYLSGYVDVLNERIDTTDRRVEFFIDKLIGLIERYKEMFSKNKSKKGRWEIGL